MNKIRFYDVDSFYNYPNIGTASDRGWLHIDDNGNESGEVSNDEIVSAFLKAAKLKENELGMQFSDAGVDEIYTVDESFVLEDLALPILENVEDDNELSKFVEIPDIDTLGEYLCDFLGGAYYISGYPKKNPVLGKTEFYKDYDDAFSDLSDMYDGGLYPPPDRW